MNILPNIEDGFSEEVLILFVTTSTYTCFASDCHMVLGFNLEHSALPCVVLERKKNNYTRFKTSLQ